ncbi:MAG: hypothetical protein ACRDHP_09360, partial [Ktedonobacterales bacterium]
MAILLGLLVGGGIALLFVGLQRVVDTQSNPVGRRLDDFIVPVPGAAIETNARRGRRARRRRAAPVYVQPDDANTSRSFTVTMARDLARA